MRANVESGIDLTMMRCTFFRDFCAFFSIMMVKDVWPLVANMADNTCKKVMLCRFVALSLTRKVSLSQTHTMTRYLSRRNGSFGILRCVFRTHHPW